jgi:hypothetical protein
MSAADLTARMLALREQWVDLAPGKRVKLRRPAEAEMAKFRGGMSVEHVASACVGWDGFTEADLLGASQGAQDAVQFDAGLWLEVLRDRLDWVGLVADAIIACVTAHLEAREAARGN